MAQLQNPMELFRHLEKSNCRECYEATCLAFAAAVFKGERQVEECPRIDPEIAARYGGGGPRRGGRLEEDAERAIASLQERIGSVDLARASDRLGGAYADGKLTLSVLGKPVRVDAAGRIYTDIHVHGWLAGPLLLHVLEGEGREPSGNWVPLRELSGGGDWYRLFGQRCEKPMKTVADAYTDLFEDMVHLFSGKRVGGRFDSDISVVLHPLPRVPILICYWKPDEGMDSDLHLFFDDTAAANLPIEAIYTLGAGMALMFEKISHRHS